jgi:hypothetical protein
MIKINLLKIEQKKGAHSFPVKAIVISALSLCVVAVVLAIVFHGAGNHPARSSSVPVEKKVTAPVPADTVKVESRLSDVGQRETLPDSGTRKPETAQPTPAGQGPTSVQSAEGPEKKQVVAAGKNAFAPSTHIGAEVIEDVVLDRSRKSSAELVALSYKEMSRGEKINYEIAFAGRVFQLLTHAAPDGIGFNSLIIDSFSTVKATGLAPTRELVGMLFRSLRNENLVLRERPVSSIRSVGGQGYRFDVACEASFGVDTSETYIATANLKPHESFNGMQRTFFKIASNDGVRLPGGLVRISTEKWGGYRRYYYHMSGSGKYRDFVKFVLALYSEHLPCSFNRIQLKAWNDTTIAIDADLVFTLKN